MSDNESMVPLARLVDGLRAYESGRSGVARFRFEQIVDATGAHPTLEVAHALRGLAQLAIREGDVHAADAQLKRAVSTYREVSRVDPAYRVRAQEGEGAALLLAGELMQRRGQGDAGDRLLDRAMDVLETLGDGRSAEGWATSGRIALHRHDLPRAELAFREAIARYEEARNYGGHAEMLLELSRLRQLRGDSSGAERMLAHAAQMAKDAGRAELYARIQLGRGQLADDPEVAKESFRLARVAAVQVGDRATAGLALVALGKTGAAGGEGPLLAGAQLLLDGGHFPGLALALLRLAEHGVQVGDTEIALVASEGAWRVYRGVDPVDGLGRVLKVLTKVFASQRMARPLLAAAFARAALVGDTTPHALQVRDHYARLAPAELVETLGALSREKLQDEARSHLQKAIVPALQRFGLRASSFATAQGALDVLGVIMGTSPRAEARRYAPITVPEDVSVLPEPTVHDLATLGVGGDTLRLDAATGASVDASAGEAPAEPNRSAVYDPSGRLAAWVSSSVTQIRDLDGESAETGSFRKVSSLDGFGEEPDPVTEEILEDRGWDAFVAGPQEVRGAAARHAAKASPAKRKPAAPPPDDDWSALLDD